MGKTIKIKDSDDEDDDEEYIQKLLKETEYNKKDFSKQREKNRIIFNN